MEFLSTMYLLIYAGLLVHATLNLAYSKEHVYYMLLTCGIIIVVPESFTFFCDT